MDEHRQTWMAEGACRSLPATAFFPSDGAGVEEARAICEGCAVQARCLDYALEQRIEHGVWGGASERQRRRILRGRRREAKEAAAKVTADSVR